MNTSLLDIINHFHYENEDNDDEMPEIPQLRRTHTIKCNMCNGLIGMPVVIMDSKIMCFRCSDQIRLKYEQFQENLRKKKSSVVKKRKCLEDVIDFGMHPNRIGQTDIFETRNLFL